MNPAVHGSDFGIGGLDDVDSVELPWDWKWPDRGQLPEPVVQHDRLGENAVSSNEAVYGSVQPAGHQPGSVPTLPRKKEGNQPNLPAQTQ